MNDADDAVTRLAKLVAAAGCVWFFLVACWGMFAIPQGGHFASSAAAGVMAENMWTWKIVAPVWEYTDTEPLPAQYYCHHPWGVFWTTAIFYKIFGHRDFVLVLPAVVMSSLTPPMLYAIAKRAWGVVAGAAAVCAFVLVPIDISFAQFNSLEVITIFGCTLMVYGLTEMLATGKRRFFALSLVGTFFACTGDWPGYLGVGGMLGWAFVRLYVLPKRWREDCPHQTYARWWAFTAAFAVVLLGFFVWQFQKAGKLTEWIGQAERRGAGDQTPLDQVLESRKFWIEMAFTPLVIAIGKIALPIAAFRVVVRRREAELFSLAAWVMATIQYVAFKGGADIHFFWPHYFGLYYALAFAQLVATIEGSGLWLAKQLAKLRARAGAIAKRAAPALALVAVVVPSAMLVPDAPHVLRYARETGGRFDEHGNLIRSETDLVRVAAWLRPQLPTHAALLVDPGFPWGWHDSWALRGITRSGSLPASRGPQNDSHPFWLTRASLIDGARRKSIVDSSFVQMIGDVWVVDTRERPAPLVAYSFEEREPGPFEWFFSAHVEPVTRIVRDPLATWELRLHYGQPADVPERAEPRTLEAARVLHNLAVATGDRAEAGRLRARIETELDTSFAAEFTQGVRLIGTRVTKSVQPRVEIWFSAEGPLASDATFDVRSTVIHPKKWSLLPQDPKERNCAYPPPIATTLWRAGFLYKIEFALFKRFGDEHFTGAWSARGGEAPRRVGDRAERTGVAFVK
jgi:4-amino-4-deoxy-L-arabinose transferase-like glycosyltransferase